jgi:hypothetical protein
MTDRPKPYILVPAGFVEFVKYAPIGSGVCCCGDDMETHASGWVCGHEPVDQWSYSLNNWLEEIDTLQQPEEPTGAPYGIIDPDYARVYTIARCLAWAEGYALLMHGSFTRDLDLVAVPWADKACDPEHLMRRIEDAADLKNITPDPTGKPHGRLTWTLVFKKFGDPRWVDLSFMPRQIDPKP